MLTCKRKIWCFHQHVNQIYSTQCSLAEFKNNIFQYTSLSHDRKHIGGLDNLICLREMQIIIGAQKAVGIVGRYSR